MDTQRIADIKIVSSPLWKNKFTQHTVKVTGSTEFRDVPLVLCRDIFSEVPETLSVELNDRNKIFQQAVNHG